MKKPSTGSVTHWISDLRVGDDEAVTEIWKRYFASLRDLARTKLDGFPMRVKDEEDVALSVIATLCLGMKSGRFPTLQDRSDLWRLLIVIVHQKVVDHKRWESRLKRRCAGTAMPTIDDLVDFEPTPELVAELEDQRRHLFESLPTDDLRNVAEAKLEGHSCADIARQRGVSERTIQRKVRYIHEHWESVLIT